MTATIRREVSDHQRRIGARLRSIRNQQGLSLAEVQERSQGRWKAVVVGAYERGDRTITIARLQELAGFYGVPLADLLPQPRDDGSDTAGTADRHVLDLRQLRYATTNGDRALLPVARFAAQVSRQRGDHNGRVLTIRGADLEMLAYTAGHAPEDLIRHMRRIGALRSSA